MYLPLAKSLLLLSLTTASPFPNSNFNTNTVANLRQDVAPAVRAAVQLPATAHQKRKSKRQDYPHENTPVIDETGYDSSGSGRDGGVGGSAVLMRRSPQDNDDFFTSTSGSDGDGSEKARRDDEDDDRYGFGPGSDGWKNAKRDDSGSDGEESGSINPNTDMGGYTITATIVGRSDGQKKV